MITTVLHALADLVVIKPAKGFVRGHLPRQFENRNWQNEKEKTPRCAFKPHYGERFTKT